MSHNPNPNADTSGFSYPSAAGVATNFDETHVGILPSTHSSRTECSSSVAHHAAYPKDTHHIGPSLDRHHGQMGDEHGGAGTRADDRKGENVRNEGDTATPVASKADP